jgi:hypothetical protein
MKASAWTPETGYPVAVVARILRMPRPAVYGLLRAYGIRPARYKGPARRGSPARIITAAQLADIKARLRAADRSSRA